MKIVAISDLHNNFIRTLPVGDILLVAGDFTSRGTVEQLTKFNVFLGRFKPYFKEILITPGNHDFLYETDFDRANSIVTNGTVLMNETHTLYNGMTIFGSPVSTLFGKWAFMIGPYDQREALWKTIPNGIDILMTHGPAFGLQDKTLSGDRAGCEALFTRLRELSNLKLHVFGHIHEEYGVLINPQGFKHISANVSICRLGLNSGLNEPTVITLND